MKTLDTRPALCAGPADYALNKLVKTASEHPRPQEVPEDCIAFSTEMEMVNAVLRATYGHALQQARAEPDPALLLPHWQEMDSLCARALAILSSLRDQFPDCGTPESHDAVLDLRSTIARKIERLQQEITCQTQTLPPGLFPENS